MKLCRCCLGMCVLGAFAWARAMGQDVAAVPANALAQAIAAQQTALASQDPQQIVPASRALAALALRMAASLEADAAHEEAVQDDRGAYELQPDPQTGLALLTAYLQAGSAEKAAQLQAELLAAMGDSTASRLQLAGAHHDAGDLNGAISELQKALAIATDADPQGPIHLALGLAFWELNEYQYNEPALHEFQAAQQAAPNDFNGNFYLGSLLSQYHRYADAAVRLHAACTAQPDNPDPWLQLGLDSYAQNQTAAAIAALEKAVALTGSDAARNSYQIRRAFAALSRLYTQQDNRAQAAHFAELNDRTTLQAAQSGAGSGVLSESSAVGIRVTTQPNHLADSNRAGEGVLPATDPKATSTGSGKVTSPAPQSAATEQLHTLAAQSLNDAGTALARNRDYAAALPNFRLAAQTGPNLTPVMRNLGLAAFHLQDYKLATEALTKALLQDPSDQLAQKYLPQARAELPAIAR